MWLAAQPVALGVSCLLHRACAAWRNICCVFSILTLSGLLALLNVSSSSSALSSCPSTMWCAKLPTAWTTPAGRPITCQGDHDVRPGILSNSAALQQVLKVC